MNTTLNVNVLQEVVRKEGESQIEYTARAAKYLTDNYGSLGVYKAVGVTIHVYDDRGWYLGEL